MNKEEVLQLAVDSGARMVSHGLSTNRTMAAFVTTETLLIFANACEKIGMEKAAKICEEDENAYYHDDCARAIRKAIE